MDSGAAVKAGGVSDAERTKSQYQAGEEVEVNYRGHGVYILYASAERHTDVPENVLCA